VARASAIPPPPLPSISRSFSYIPSIAFFPDFTFSYETFIRTRSLGFAYVLMVSDRFLDRACRQTAIHHFFEQVCITNVTIYNVRYSPALTHPPRNRLLQWCLFPPFYSLLLFQFLRALVIPFSIVISFYQFRTLPSAKAGDLHFSSHSLPTPSFFFCNTMHGFLFHHAIPRPSTFRSVSSTATH
jgi:hypothetical protein